LDRLAILLSRSFESADHAASALFFDSKTIGAVHAQALRAFAGIDCTACAARFLNTCGSAWRRVVRTT
jgi:hypothetical protein